MNPDPSRGSCQGTIGRLPCSSQGRAVDELGGVRRGAEGNSLYLCAPQEPADGGRPNDVEGLRGDVRGQGANERAYRPFLRGGLRAGEKPEPNPLDRTWPFTHVTLTSLPILSPSPSHLIVLTRSPYPQATKAAIAEKNGDIDYVAALFQCAGEILVRATKNEADPNLKANQPL